MFFKTGTCKYKIKSEGPNKRIFYPKEVPDQALHLLPRAEDLHRQVPEVARGGQDLPGDGAVRGQCRGGE